MKKYRCECRKAKCEVEREDKFKPEYCTCFCTKEAEWQEVKEEEKAEEKAEELPSWCKVGEVVYYTKLSKYCKVVDIDITKGIKIQTELSNGWVENFYDLLEVRLRPFDESEMRELVGKTITNKTSEEVFLVTYFNKGYVGLGNLCLTAEELLNEYTISDGTPCGVYEHKENGEWVK